MPRDKKHHLSSQTPNTRKKVVNRSTLWAQEGLFEIRIPDLLCDGSVSVNVSGQRKKQMLRYLYFDVVVDAQVVRFCISSRERTKLSGQRILTKIMLSFKTMRTGEQFLLVDLIDHRVINHDADLTETSFEWFVSQEPKVGRSHESYAIPGTEKFFVIKNLDI